MISLRRFLALFSLLAAGCAVPPILPVAPQATLVRSYEVGQTRRSAIGDPIFDAAQNTGPLVFVLAQTLQINYERTVAPGARFETIGRLADGSLVVRSQAFPSAGVSITPEGRVASGWVTLDGTMGKPNMKLPEGQVFRPIEEERRNAFRAQIIYSGLDGRTLRAVYREFAGDMIRPAFSQELQYDLTQDSTLAFRTVRIRVMRATNAELEYVITEDGGLPWLPAP